LAEGQIRSFWQFDHSSHYLNYHHHANESRLAHFYSIQKSVIPNFQALSMPAVTVRPSEDLDKVKITKEEAEFCVSFTL
jgi:hypothetical protein